MSYYIAREGQTYGPYSPEHAHEMIGRGELVVDDLACPEGAEEWSPLGRLLGLSRPAPATQHPSVLKPLAASYPAIPVAQPASAVTPPGFKGDFRQGSGAQQKFTSPVTASRSEKSTGFANTSAGLTAAAAIIFASLPLLAWVAGPDASGGLPGFLGGTLGVLWGAVVGLTLAAACLWWFVLAKRKAAARRP